MHKGSIQTQLQIIGQVAEQEGIISNDQSHHG